MINVLSSVRVPVGRAMLVAVLSMPLLPAACNDDRPAGERLATTRPIIASPTSPPTNFPTTALTSAASPAPDADSNGAVRPPWLTVDEKIEPAKRAWIEGAVVGQDRVVVSTSNVRGFRLDLSLLKVDWSRGVVLRIDGYNSELTRKRWPVLKLALTASGAWEPTD